MMLLNILFFPFILVGKIFWGIAELLFGIMGGMISLLVSIVAVIVGVVLCASLVGSIVGIPLLALGGVMLFRGCRHGG